MAEAGNVDPAVERLVQWADHHEAVRTVLLTSTRAVPGAKVDVFSDYDVILVIRDVQPFVTDRAWIGDFGEVLVAWWDSIPPDPGSGIEQTGNVVQYVDGLKIDFGLWSVAYLESVAAQPALPAELDAGYLVLVDKDGLTSSLAQPTYTGYALAPPDLATCLDNVEGFFVGAPYVAKCLLRDELLPAKWCLDIDMRDTYLRPMLTWWVGCQQGWSVNLGALGKGLKRHLPSETWAELEASWAGAGIEDNWESLFGLMALYRRVAAEVTSCLGYPFPDEMAERVGDFARRMRAGEFGTVEPR